MLYKFKSRVTGDIIMLEPQGRRILEILGKDPKQPGIVTPEQIPAAIAALEAAIAAQEAAQRAAIAEAEAQGHPPPKFDGLQLRQRSLPLLDMLRRSAQADREVVWGV